MFTYLKSTIKYLQGDLTISNPSSLDIEVIWIGLAYLSFVGLVQSYRNVCNWQDQIYIKSMGLSSLIWVGSIPLMPMLVRGPKHWQIVAVRLLQRRSCRITNLPCKVYKGLARILSATWCVSASLHSRFRLQVTRMKNGSIPGPVLHSQIRPLSGV